MLRTLSELCGCKLLAVDGQIGQVQDLIFDLQTWTVRYLIADAGSCLMVQEVLLSPDGIDRFDQPRNALCFNLSKRTVENGPQLKTPRGVSREFELEYAKYYGIPADRYRLSFGPPSGGPAPLKPLPAAADAGEAAYRARNHLRSAQAVIGCQIQIADGPMGEVGGLIIDDENWAICEIIVGAGLWHTGKELSIPIAEVERISCL